MKLSQTITDMVMYADAKALATYHENNLNVVPVSTVKIINDTIVLVNYFMGKTLENIQNNNNVSLACWKGLNGCQIKATVDYQTEGQIFNEITAWVGEILPDRVVKGILVLTPQQIFDASATSEHPGKQIL